MDVQKELEKWKSEYAACNTPEELTDHAKRFRAFLQTLSPEDKKAFAQVFQNGARQSINEARDIVKAVEIRQTLEKVLPFASMSYIAQHYFGKTRQWLYQRINGSAVNGKPANFTIDELNTLSMALSELGDIMKDTSRSIARP
ncbi:DUF5053 domain-containing protein [uncultured Bacteroides sp.]|uniref:DUF5053 domain-containing protein n=1 Tax=uncultured Bacteroides sp. TaxID=162156 RepID=UPI00261E06A7|nr:DUF5053 domain-containing protein [uncultured Bacteroides sp.]